MSKFELALQHIKNSVVLKIGEWRSDYKVQVTKVKIANVNCSSLIANFLVSGQFFNNFRQPSKVPEFRCAATFQDTKITHP